MKRGGALAALPAAMLANVLTNMLTSMAAAWILGSSTPFAAAQDPEVEFARQALAAVAAQDDVLLGALTRESPQRARLLGHEVLWEALRTGSGAERPFAAARHLARILAEDPSQAVEVDLGAVVARVERMDEAERARQRELDRAFFAATAAFGRGERVDAGADAGFAAEEAAALELPYLELRARRLLAECLRNEAGFRDAMLRVLELERALGLWIDEGADLAALAEVEHAEGRLLEAARRLERAEELARRCGDPERALELSARRGAVLANLGSFEAADELLTRARAHFEAHERAAEAAQAVTLLGELAGGAGRYEEALARFAEARRAAHSAGDARGEVRATIRLAGTYSELGLVADAEDALERAQAIIREHELAPERERWLLARGLVLLDAGRPRQALDALGAIERPQSASAAPDPLFAEARRHAGAAHLVLGEAPEGEQAFRAALAAWSSDPLQNSWARTGLGDALFSLGKRAAAEREYAAALAEAEGTTSLEGSWRARLGLASCAEADGRNEEALTHVMLAIAEIEALRSLLAAPALRTRWLGNKLEPYHRGTRLLARAGRLEQAFALAEAAKARTLLELAARPLAPRDEVTREAYEGRASAARARLAQAESRARLLEFQLGALPRSPASAATRAELATRLREAHAEHEAARLELQLVDPRGATLIGLADSPALAATQGALRADERMLHYSIGSAGASLFALGPHGVRFIELETSEAELAALVGRILDPIERLREGRLDLTTLGFDARAALELYQRLIEPAREELAGGRTLWIVADGPLRRLPFGLLVSKREKRPVDPGRLFAQYAGCRFLIEDFAVGELPSAGLLLAPPVPPAGGERLVVADPSPMPDGGARLAWSRAEARAVAESGAGSPVRLLLGPDAGEARVKAALRGARFVHFATHGLLDDRRPSFSRLALAPERGEDGWLHAYEVEELALAAERVVLSACETLGEAGRGEGLLGLARAFLQAGARAVVASAWPVDDQATAQLMQRYQEALARGDEPVAALRAAQLGLLRGAGRPELLQVHPYFWAGFRHVGSR